jgi:hypothetical protein
VFDDAAIALALLLYATLPGQHIHVHQRLLLLVHARLRCYDNDTLQCNNFVTSITGKWRAGHRELQCESI